MITHWHDFFVAEAGASAALAGLVFVAVSINLARILAFPHLPARAVETLTALLSVLLIASFGLVPDQSLRALGIEIALSALFVMAIQLIAIVRTHGAVSKYVSAPAHAAINLGPPLPFLIAGGLLTMGDGSGLYWIVPGTLLSFAAGILGAWVLLVEIQR